MAGDGFDQLTGALTDVTERLNEYAAVWQAATAANADGTYKAEHWLDDVQTLWVMAAHDLAKGFATYIDAMAKTVPAGDEAEPEDGVSDSG
jgi:hypothetical protein